MCTNKEMLKEKFTTVNVNTNDTINNTLRDDINTNVTKDKLIDNNLIIDSYLENLTKIPEENSTDCQTELNKSHQSELNTINNTDQVINNYQFKKKTLVDANIDDSMYSASEKDITNHLQSNIEHAVESEPINNINKIQDKNMVNHLQSNIEHAVESEPQKHIGYDKISFEIIKNQVSNLDIKKDIINHKEQSMISENKPTEESLLPKKDNNSNPNNIEHTAILNKSLDPKNQKIQNELIFNNKKKLNKKKKKNLLNQKQEKLNLMKISNKELKDKISQADEKSKVLQKHNNQLIAEQELLLNRCKKLQTINKQSEYKYKQIAKKTINNVSPNRFVESDKKKDSRGIIAAGSVGLSILSGIGYYTLKNKKTKKPKNIKRRYRKSRV